MAGSSVILNGERYWYSPYVFTVFVALREKGIPFEVREIDLDAGEQREQKYRSRSITGRVPCIEHDDFVLSESTAIVEYLDEAFPMPKWPSVLPEGARNRARARQVLGWLRSDLMPIREERSTETMFYGRAPRPLSPTAQAAADKLFFGIDRLVPDGATSLFGAFCIADADLAFMLHRLILNGDPVPSKARAYAEAQWARPSVRAFVEHRRPTR